MKLFPANKRVVVTASGAPTFTYAEVEQRTDKAVLKPTLPETSQRSDSSVVKPTLSETLSRSDNYRVPTASLAAPETRSWVDRPQVPAVLVSDQRGQADVATIRVDLTTAGTYTIGVPVTGNYSMASWGAGGRGGSANVNGGGGGSGGPFCSTASVAATAGNSLTVKVGAGSTTGTVEGSFVSTTGAQPTTTTQGVYAEPGVAGGNATPTVPGAAGVGSVAASVGDVKTAGASGTAGNVGQGGNGGDGATGAGTPGGTGGTGATAVAQGTVPTTPGGGAGGAHTQPRRASATGRASFTFTV